MCTVTFIPRQRGYRLAMNRDEQRTRPVGLPPARHQYPNGVTVIYPSEPSGGTWISLNDSGVSLALINWYSVPARVRDGRVSRGEVVRRLAAIRDARELKQSIRELPLDRINPFRLIAVFAAPHQIVEYRWSLCSLQRLELPWHPQQWISSGFDEHTAQRVRSEVFRAKCLERDFGSSSWLWRLHSSHQPQAGPFSTCMHRDDAVTVSYTEIAFSNYQTTMRYQARRPVQMPKPIGGTFQWLSSNANFRSANGFCWKRHYHSEQLKFAAVPKERGELPLSKASKRETSEQSLSSTRIIIEPRLVVKERTEREYPCGPFQGFASTTTDTPPPRAL